MSIKGLALALTVGWLSSGSAVQAALTDAGNGLVDDTVLNICWVADASLSGAQNWDDLVDWAANLDYGGYQDWRLASMSVANGTPTGSTGTVVACETDTEQNCRDNELGYMYTYYLPGNYGDDKTGNQTVGDVELTGIQNTYWSGTNLAVAPLTTAWLFVPADGIYDFGSKVEQHYGWAVRPGQCRAAPADATPVPAVGALGFGLLALLLAGVARSRLR